ncbi:MAG TPA: hypothetical protein VNA20_12045 [Frankiaceae bacterium]|nr:hypothetical protein [Frankiaceae bacterium]
MRTAIGDATALLAVQHGLAHRAQLRQTGLGDAQVESRLRSGSWALAAVDVVGVAGAPRSPEWAAWRVALAVGIRADGRERPVAVGGQAAAALLGLTTEVPSVVEVVVARGIWRPRVDGARVREVSDWRERRFVRRGGLLLTARPETLVDCAPYFTDDEFLRLLQDACYADPWLLGRVLDRCHRGSKGSARARRVGAALAAGYDSALHAEGVRTLRRAGLVPHACGVEVVVGAGPSDCVYLTGGRPVLAVEFDGDVHRLSRKAFLHDRAKDLALRAAGCATLRFTVEQVRQPARLVAAVRQALALTELPVPPRVAGVA